jgi:transcriptional regulator of met regulon
MTATMYGSPMAEHSQKTNAAARIAINMPNTVVSLLSVT